MERRDLTPDRDPSGRCPACGAFAPADAVACPTCGEPLALASDEAPLPPLPDGGLAALMPAWLRGAPENRADKLDVSPPTDRQPGDIIPWPAQFAARPDGTDRPPASAGPDRPPAAPAAAAAAPAGVSIPGATPSGAAPGGRSSTFDPAGLISADDLPAWLRAIGGNQPSGQPADSTSGALLPDVASASASASAPVFLPRAEPRSAAAADPDEIGKTHGGKDAAGAAVGAARVSRAEAHAVAKPAAGSPAMQPPIAAASLALGDEGSPPAVAPERDDVSSSRENLLAEVGVAGDQTESGRDAATPDAARTDAARGNESGDQIQEGVAAGIATLAIMIVAAAILFLVWRAAGQ